MSSHHADLVDAQLIGTAEDDDEVPTRLQPRQHHHHQQQQYHHRMYHGLGGLQNDADMHGALLPAPVASSAAAFVDELDSAVFGRMMGNVTTAAPHPPPPPVRTPMIPRGEVRGGAGNEDDDESAGLSLGVRRGFDSATSGVVERMRNCFDANGMIMREKINSGGGGNGGPYAAASPGVRFERSEVGPYVTRRHVGRAPHPTPGTPAVFHLVFYFRLSFFYSVFSS